MKTGSPQILVLDSTGELFSRITDRLAGKDLQIFHEKLIDHLLHRFEDTTFDLVLITGEVCRESSTDYIQILNVLTQKSPRTQIILLVEKQDISIAMKALKIGSYHYARLPISDKELVLLVETALSDQPAYGENIMLKQETVERFEQLIGQSPSMQTVYEQIRQAASTDIPILIIGETGTGKDLAAQAIHRLSNFAQGPYIPVNLGALPSELTASELFGHEAGAFTGARKQHKGVFEQSKDGTVFLDEIDAIDEKVQISLLRLIEQKKFKRLGGSRFYQTNARLITASNADLEELVKQGVFREDLYYRIDVFRIIMPPLRERLTDIPLLIDNMVSRYNQQFRKNIQKITPEAIDTLHAYDWPGNVRELKNVIQRAVLVCNDRELLPIHLPVRFRDLESTPDEITFKIGTSLATVEHELIRKVLNYTENNRKKTAEILGISRRALYNKLKKYGID